MPRMSKEDSRNFFDKAHCDRCSTELNGRIMSFFTSETICMDCSAEEKEIKEKLKEIGENLDDYEGCGYVPDVDEIKGG